MISIYEVIIASLAANSKLKIVDIDNGEKPALTPAAQVTITPIDWYNMGTYKRAEIEFEIKFTYAPYHNSESKSPVFDKLKSELSLTREIKPLVESIFDENILHDVTITGESLGKKKENYQATIICKATAFSQVE